MTLLDSARRIFNRARAYRFDGEQANHAEQAAQTEVSLGLLAVAATHHDDEHRIQAMQTERTLRDRLDVLTDYQAQRGLTLEERGEMESIRRGLIELNPPVATPEALGGQRMALFGEVGAAAANPLLTGAIALASSPLTWIAAGLAAFGVQTARLDHAKHDLSEARQTAAANARAAAGWQERAEHYRTGLIDAAAVAHQAADALEAERARQARAAARERNRNREIANVLAHSPEPPAWRLRDDAAEGEPTAPSP